MKGAVKMTGRERCRLMKELRRTYADAEGLDIVISDCSYTGECTGTCPSCEAEMRAMARLLERKALSSTFKNHADCQCSTTEWVVGDRNTEIVVISCTHEDCGMLNTDMEELGLSESTF